MADIKVLVGSSCVGANRKHYAKGEIRTYDDDNPTHQIELTQLRAAGRIAPVTKENCAIVIEQLKAADPKAEIPKALQAAADSFEQPKHAK